MTLTNPAAETATRPLIDALVADVFGPKLVLTRPELYERLGMSPEWLADRIAEGSLTELRLSPRKHVTTRDAFAEYLRRTNGDVTR